MGRKILKYLWWALIPKMNELSCDEFSGGTGDAVPGLSLYSREIYLNLEILYDASRGGCHV
jgi:hypothetical protein